MGLTRRNQRGKENDRHVPQIGMSAKLLSHVAPVETGHVYIEENELRFEVARGPKRTMRPVFEGSGIESRFLQHDGHQLGEVDIIVDNKNSGFIHKITSWWPPVGADACLTTKATQAQR